MHWGGFGWMFGGFFGLMLIVIIILVIIWAVRRSTGCCGWSWREGTGSALDIARERYARGEISKDEYDELKKNLQ